MTFDRVLEHSFERLVLMLKAKQASRARMILDLAYLTAGNEEAWRETQKRLLDDINGEDE